MSRDLCLRSIDGLVPRGHVPSALELVPLGRRETNQPMWESAASSR